MARQTRQLLPLTLLTAFVLPAAAPAQLQVAEPVVNVGTVYSGQPLVRTFAFVNAGPETVDIMEAKGSCACAAGKMSGTKFAPGERGTVTMSVHTLGQAPGPNAWGVTLRCKTGGRETEVSLRINADLVSHVYCKPAALQLLISEALAAEFSIHDDRNQPFSVTGVATSSPGLKATLTGPVVRTSAQAVWVYKLEVTDAYPEGRREEIVSVYTDDPAYAELKMPVTIVKTAKQRVSATPGQLLLVALPGQPVTSRVVLLRDAENEAVQIDNITPDHPALSCSWAAGPGEMVTLKVRVDPKAVPMEGLRTAVHVEVHKPVTQTLTVPVEIRREN
jgi:hypothetical protein